MKLFLLSLCFFYYGFLLFLQGGEDDEIKPNIENQVENLLDAFANADNLGDRDLLEKRAELEALGEKAFPAMCNLLKNKTSPFYQARIIESFERMDGDDTLPMEAVRELLQSNQDPNTTTVAHHAALRFLIKKGDKKDIAIIDRYIDSEDLIAKRLAEIAKKEILERNK